MILHSTARNVPKDYFVWLFFYQICSLLNWKCSKHVTGCLFLWTKNLSSEMVPGRSHCPVWSIVQWRICTREHSVSSNYLSSQDIPLTQLVLRKAIWGRHCYNPFPFTQKLRKLSHSGTSILGVYNHEESDPQQPTTRDRTSVEAYTQNLGKSRCWRWVGFWTAKWICSWLWCTILSDINYSLRDGCHI